MERLARMGSILLMLAVAACSNATTSSPTVGASATPSAMASSTRSPSPTPSFAAIPTASPTPSPTPSPRPMSPATLKRGPNLPTAREGHTAVRLADGRVLMMGGVFPFTGICTGMACTNAPTKSVEVYDPKSGKFSHFGSLIGQHHWATALLLDDGRVLVAPGGYDDSTMEIYDPFKKTSLVVKPPADTPKLPGASSVVLLDDGRVLIAGGFWDDNYVTSDLTFILDPASGKLSKGPTLAESRLGATATLLHDGRVLVVGGDYYDLDGRGYSRHDAELIDPSQPLARPTLIESQTATTSALLADQRVLIAGGATDDSSSNCAPVAPQVFDPEAEEFTSVSPMTSPRSRSTAVRIRDGRVVLFGGMTAECAPADTVEAFDPDSGTFQQIATGFPSLNGYTATQLDDGTILIAGGWGDTGMIAETWLLKP